MTKSTGGGGRGGGGGRTIDARAAGVSITRQEVRSPGGGVTGQETITFTRAGNSWSTNVTRINRFPNRANETISASDALATAVERFNRANNVTLTNLPRPRRIN